MKIHKPYCKQAIIFALITALLLNITGCGSDKAEEAIAPNTTGQQAQTSIPAPVDTPAAAPDQRAYRTQIKGGGKDVVTLMVYLCGSDLESEGGAATIDLIEMMSADIGKNLNIIVETGGADEWATEYMDPNLNQRWRVVNEDLEPLMEMNAKNMSEGSTLQDFITYSATNFPADRYMLLLWDHGGGTVDGYAYDERFDNDSMMSLAELDSALAGAGVAFDMIGFDCCLMGTAETAFMAEKYADYMVASQRVEPGKGWFYTPWLNALSKNTSIPTAELGKLIVDSFIEDSGDGYYSRELTLSVTDLTYIPALFQSMYGFFSEVKANLVKDDLFIETSKTVGGSRAMQSEFDLVDLDYLLKSIDGSEELQSKLNQCVVYNGATIENYNGLCLYFPYSDLYKVGDALELYEQIGIDKSYQDFIAAYANIMLGGQVYNSGGGGGNASGGDGFDMSYWLTQSWADEEQWDVLAGFYSENSYDDTVLTINKKGDGYVLSLPEEDWELITTANLRVFLDDVTGYVDLGEDGVYEFDDDGDLMIQFDYSWVSLNGQFVCFYQQEAADDGEYWYSYGTVPIMYNNKEAELVLVWDSDNPDGYVAGWRYTTFGGQSQKGMFELKDGMNITFVGDFYSYDMEFENRFSYLDMTIDGPLTVSYEYGEDVNCVVYYQLYDIYQNLYWTEPLLYDMDADTGYDVAAGFVA